MASWLTSPDNPYFARAIANRIWSNFFGLGIINQIDDLRVSNPASNEPLLDALAKHIVEKKFDLKALMRTILQSETYQRSSKPLPENIADNLYFSRHFPRRSVGRSAAGRDRASLRRPDRVHSNRFQGSGLPRHERLSDWDARHSVGGLSRRVEFLKAFGRNERDITCECERSNKPSIVQVLHINNGVTINDRLSSEKSCVSKAIDAKLEAEKVIQDAFMKALSRPPTESELERLTAVLAESKDDAERRQAVEDLYWSVLSSREFLFNH